MPLLMSARSTSRPNEQEHSELDRALNRLLRRLLATARRRGSCDPPSGRGGEPPERWEDDDYVYIETSAPGIDRDIDISVHAGHVLIRMEK